MSTGKKFADILVIADQERLLALFEPEGELPGVRVRKAFTIDDGIKSAAAAAPSLLFFQGRMGGLSAEIIARHLRLELKDAETRMVMICAPEDLPETGIKFLYATIDSSLPDGQLAELAWSVVATVASGGKKAHFRANKSAVRKTGACGGKKSGSCETAAEAASPAKQAEAIHVENARRESSGSDRTVSVSAENTEDIVEIRTTEILPRDTGEDFSPSATDAAFAANFRDTLECVLEKAAGVAGPSRAEQAPPEINPELSGRWKQQSPPSVGAGIPRGTRVRTIIAALSVLSLAGLIFLYFGLRPAAEKADVPHPAMIGKVPASGRPGLPSGPAINAPGKIREIPRPALAEKQIPEGYISYKVRRGDTILNILTARFGLSARNAAEILPEVLEKNGIDGKTVLVVGQTILIPESMKLQIKK